MEEIVTAKDGRFLRPRRRQEENGGDGFQDILKKILRGSLSLLFLSCSVFLGHGVYAHLLEHPSFRLREVDIQGSRQVSRETLFSLARVEGMPNLFTVPLKDIGRRLESHPWIESVVLEKVFPHKIVIQVVERKPIALVQLEELYYMDAKGVIFSPAGEGAGYNYPVLTGLTRQDLEARLDVTKPLLMKALELLVMANKERTPPLGAISEIKLEKMNGIQCFTKAEGLAVRLGWDQFDEKLKRLSLVWSDVKKRGWSAVSIDCSDLNRMVVKRAPGG